jgi:soluble lytic murein transglycosylase-like protein
MTRSLHQTGRAATALSVLCAAIVSFAAPSAADAGPARQPNCANVGPDLIASFVTEAATRFGVPEDWVRAVMRMESGGDRCVISPAGAQGLMQLMPRTYAELKARYGLGSDPFDAHDNVIAGAAYLREMWDRFGATGFLAAYNAGPGRFQDHLVTGRPLSDATRAYVAALMPITIGFANAADLTPARPNVSRAPPLFVQIGGAPTAASAVNIEPSERGASAGTGPTGLQQPGLFAAVSTAEVR